eukprot:scaffold2923_cov313-Pinguiococcus_pyrenoidosus.AAC.17
MCPGRSLRGVYGPRLPGLEGLSRPCRGERPTRSAPADEELKEAPPSTEEPPSSTTLPRADTPSPPGNHEIDGQSIPWQLRVRSVLQLVEHLELLGVGFVTQLGGHRLVPRTRLEEAGFEQRIVGVVVLSEARIVWGLSPRVPSCQPIDGVVVRHGTEAVGPLFRRRSDASAGRHGALLVKDVAHVAVHARRCGGQAFQHCPFLALQECGARHPIGHFVSRGAIARVLSLLERDPRAHVHAAHHRGLPEGRLDKVVNPDAVRLQLLRWAALKRS